MRIRIARAEKIYKDVSADVYDIVSIVVDMDVTVDAMRSKNIVRLRITHFVLEQMIGSTPWFMFRRRSLLKSALLFSHEERIKFVKSKSEEVVI